MLYLNREEMFSLLSHEMAIEACEEGMVLQARGEAEEIPRFRFDLTGPRPSWLAYMPAAIKVKGYIGLRVFGGSPTRFLYILWDARDGTPLALMDAQAIRDVRTGAVGAISAKYLARPDSQTVGILGSGNQARHGFIAHAKLFKFTKAKVFSPTKEHREAFARDLSPLTNVEIEPVDSAERAQEGMDIIITGSNVNLPSQPPLVLASWLRPGLHLSSIGGRSELEDGVVTGASRVVIDTKEGFPLDAYDVTVQVQKGLISWDQIDELHEVVGGLKPGRQSPEEITLVKTVGTSLQDLLPAARAYELAKQRGIGRDLGDLFPPVSAAWR